MNLCILFALSLILLQFFLSLFRITPFIYFLPYSSVPMFFVNFPFSIFRLIIRLSLFSSASFLFLFYNFCFSCCFLNIVLFSNLSSNVSFLFNICYQWISNDDDQKFIWPWSQSPYSNVVITLIVKYL